MNEQGVFKPEVNPKTAILLLFIGAISTGYFVIWPVWQVQHNAPQIDYSLEGSVVGILLIFLGVFMLAAPEKYAAFLWPDKNNIKLKDVLVTAGLLIVSFSVIAAMDLYFKSKGYR